MAQRKLPSTYNQKFGTLNTTKGRWKEKQILAWDSIPKCRGEECAASEDCKQLQDQNINHVRCSVMSNYLRGVTGIIMHNYELSEPDLMRVGLNLIPLYKNLCRLQIEEHGLRTITTLNKAGNRSVNPIYDAIRNYILAIDRLWNALDFDKKYKGIKGGKRAPQVEDVDDLIHGDPDYYEGLSDDEDATLEAEEA